MQVATHTGSLGRLLPARHHPSCAKAASPLRDKPAKGVADEDGRPRKGFHDASQICHMLRQTARLHLRQPLALPLPSQAHCIAVIPCCCKVWQKVLLQSTASIRVALSDTWRNKRLLAASASAMADMAKVDTACPKLQI